MIKNDLQRNDEYHVDAYVVDDDLARLVEYSECEIYSSKLFH